MHIVFIGLTIMRLINFVLRLALAAKPEKKLWAWNQDTQQWVSVKAP